ncbi:MAG: hypothetical protein JSV43_01300 [Methanobacteriota archaeon]|nr:MAG: hypothetical protein JSV43_01300 [Euryarchaeota archaeon]
MKHCRYRHSNRWDEEGVASTVGTIMALLVFLTFMSLIVNQYVPVWMKDAESAHMNEAFGQFGNLKSSVDNQVLACQVARQAQRTCMKITTFTPITLGVDGVPLFASPTVGHLRMNRWDGNVSIDFSYQAGNFTEPEWWNSSGNIELRVLNKYYVQQRLIYENGGILVFQPDGQLVGVSPHFTVDNYSSHMKITLSQITLDGTGGVSGVSTEGVHSTLSGLEDLRYLNLTSDFNLTIFTEYESSWFNYYNDTLFEAFDYPEIVELSGTPTNFIRTMYFEVAYSIADGYTRIRIYNTANLPIEELFLVRATFEIDVGETTGRV